MYLTQNDFNPDPFQQFAQWYQPVEQDSSPTATACFLATANHAAIPSVRTVLLKGFDSQGFVFFTNYQSHKSHDLLENPVAALLFFWPDSYRQIRLEGRVEPTTVAESNDYFQSRPRGSQIGAHASPQSQVIPNREFLEQRCAEIEKQFAGQQVPRPEHWGGFRLVPELFEFWQGQENRLHDRFRYRKEAGHWLIERLAP